MYSEKQKRTADLLAFIASEAGKVERQKQELEQKLERQRIKRMSL